MKKQMLYWSAAAALILVSCAGENRGGNKGLEPFNLGHLNSTAHLLGFVAKEEGFFAEEGLAVTLTQAASSGELLKGLEDRKLDAVFLGSVPAITFQSQGRDISMFGGAMTNGHGFVIRPEFTENRSSWDITILRGRKVASVENSMQDVELLFMLNRAGLDKDRDLERVYYPSQEAAYNALITGEVDAAPVYSPYSSMAQGMEFDVVFYCADEADFAEQPCCRQVALTDTLNRKAETFEAFERALIKAYWFSLTNRDRTLADVAKYINIKREYIDYEVYGGLSVSSPDPDKKATIRVKDRIVSLGYAKDYDINRLYNTGIYKNALDSLAKADQDNPVYRRLQSYFAAYN
ncbi:MAG: ABC transporter substrate-binding protein [Treponema sp.]|jgi:NitT/TauT family transport system substrate-binding protein|nr:ABC transporter substrate-binding protein [Treponema sp.]